MIAMILKVSIMVGAVVLGIYLHLNFDRTQKRLEKLGPILRKVERLFTGGTNVKE